MSKTAMQELIDKIQYSIDVQSGVSLIETLTETQVNTLKAVMLVAERLLEKEKEQSIELIKQTAMFMAAAPLDEEIAKMSYEDVYNSYYNQTYNQNEG
jgi:hypothetical protein